MLLQANDTLRAMSDDLQASEDLMGHSSRGRSASRGGAAAGQGRARSAPASASRQDDGTAAAAAAAGGGSGQAPLSTGSSRLPPSTLLLYKVRAIFKVLKQCDLLPTHMLCNGGEQDSSWREWMVEEGACRCPGGCLELRQTLGIPDDAPCVDYSSNWATPNTTLGKALEEWGLKHGDILTGGLIRQQLARLEQERGGPPAGKAARKKKVRQGYAALGCCH